MVYLCLRVCRILKIRYNDNKKQTERHVHGEKGTLSNRI